MSQKEAGKEICAILHTVWTSLCGRNIKRRRERLILTIRGVYDGQIFRALPTEPVPAVQREVPVAIIFLEDVADISHSRQYQVEVAKRMRAARQAMAPLGIYVKDLVEAGCER